MSELVDVSELVEKIRTALDDDERIAKTSHIVAMRKILDIWVERYGDITAEIPNQTICDDVCVRIIGEYILGALAEALGINTPEQLT